MMEYRVVFRTKYGRKAKRTEAPNPLAAINEVLAEWENVMRIQRIETIIETAVGETPQPTELDVSNTEQHIHVNVTK